MDKDSSWIETWSDGKIGFQPRYFATSAAVIIIGLTEKGEAEFQNSFLLRNNSIRNSLSLSLSLAFAFQLFEIITRISKWR